MTLHLHRAERADHLAGVLAAVLAAPLGDPFAAEVVAVPTRGVERWLSQRLSLTLGTSPGGADGVCANVAFPFPGKVVADAVASVTGRRGVADSWLPERAVWPLLEVIREQFDEPWLAALASHARASEPGSGAGDGTAGVRLFSIARHLADLFDRYAFHRLDMVNAWADGHDTDGRGEALPADLVWQAALWRRLRDRIGQPGPAERLVDACDRIRLDPGLVSLPPRLGLFGLTRLPAGFLDVLDAVAVARDVHLFLLHPSPVLWDRLVAAGAGTRPRDGEPVARRNDLTVALVQHPLLASWGRDAREMQVLLGSLDRDRDRDREPGPESIEARPSRLLLRLQADIRADRRPSGRGVGREDQRLVLDPDDRSIQVHACHGTARQVEVLREAILHLLADDPTLQPRDIIVMCPDIDTFTPLIHATFGADLAADAPDDDVGDPAHGRGPTLTVRLADRSLRQTNPILAVVSELLSLVGSRFPASAVLDFADREPVRRRFRFDDDDLARIEEWVAEAGVRWGIDGEHRRPFKLHEVTSNTWRSGLDRVLLGVTMTEEELCLVGGVLPVDDVDSGDIDRAGRLAELVDRLGFAVDELTHPKPIAAWAKAIGLAADSLTSTSETDRWQRAQLERILADVVDEATASRGDADEGRVTNDCELGIDDLRALLADRLRGRPTRANFRTGHLTMCTLVPMRSVPHRVVCLLGLDDGVFPRRTAVDGDDLLERDPCIGDPDARSEDRQLLLDALLAATEQLVITYQGRDERSNLVRPPSVPLGELLDVIDHTARTEQAEARSQVVVQHPLQPYDARNFAAGALGHDQPWSFDPIALGGAQASIGTRVGAPLFLTGALAMARDDVIEIDRLVQFVTHPAKTFLRQRLGLSLRGPDEDSPDSMPIELDSLEEWGVGQRLLDHRLAGADADTCRAAEVARGTLPPHALGGLVIDAVMPKVDGLLKAVTDLTSAQAERRSITVTEQLADGRLLVGTIPLVLDRQLRSVTYSSLAAKHRLAAWVRWLALSLARPDESFEAVTIGRFGRRVRIATITAPHNTDGPRRAFVLDRLAELVDLYERGMREPLPLYAKTSCAYAEAVAGGRDGFAAAAKEWETREKWDFEDREPEHVLVRGGIVPFGVVFGEAARTGERDDTWPVDASRFGGLARRLWDPLLAVEKVSFR